MIALLVGAALAALALIFVIWPLFAPPRGSRRAPRQTVVARSDSAVRALREIEFDRATGKLADSDYEELRADYTARALTEMRKADRAVVVPTAGAPGDRAEALINSARMLAVSCAACDAVCPEPDAVYCSACGAYLPGHCSKCGVHVAESAARFCTACGWELAA